MLREISDILSIILLIFTGLLGVITILVLPRLSYLLKLMAIYCIVSASTEIFAYGLANAHVSNLFLIHAYTLLEFFILTLFFNQSYHKFNHSFKLWLILWVGGFLIVANTAFIQGIAIFNSYSGAAVSLYVIICAFILFQAMLGSDVLDNEVVMIKIFLICLLLYHCATIVVLLFSNELLGISYQKQEIIWVMRKLVVLVTRVIFVYLFASTMYDMYQIERSRK